MPFQFDYDCVPHPIFTEWHEFSFLGMFTFHLTEFQIHTGVLSMFASLIGPFGGFFASGLKRALKIKDFSSLIPEHGGFVDRFDCAILINMVTYVYVFNVIYKSTPSMAVIS